MRFWKPAAAITVGVLALAAIGLRVPALAGDEAKLVPAPATDMAKSAGPQTATFAGGCFWGIQGVFEHVRGVTGAVSGYAGGTLDHPGYEQVSTGTTGHAESVRVTYDPSVVSYGQLLQIFFSVALNPTEIDRQGGDEGSQYRSDLFVANAEQGRVARAYIAQLDAAHIWPAPIATRVDAAGTFWPAEAYHQDFLTLHPDQGYIAMVDMPKVRALQAMFPAYWQATPVTVGRLAAE